MHEVHAALKSFYISISILLLFLLFCCWIITDCKSLWIRVWTWMTSRMFSAREEKASLTRSKIYSANGYLVNSDSDINLDCTGSFKRFDSIDRDFGINLASTSLLGDHETAEKIVVPQELFKALTPANPVKRTKTLPPIIRENTTSQQDSENVLTIAIPRPKSSMTISELASKSNFPIPLLPPPITRPSGLPQKEIGQPSISKPQVDEQEIVSATLKRAMSCDSVCSDSSVLLGDLEEANVTGYLCLGLEYDSELSNLIVNLLEAKDLVGLGQDKSQIDSYVKIYLQPNDTSNAQTRLYKGSSSPTYKERFLFSLHPREQSQKYLCFHVYAKDQLSHILIGEGEIRLSDISLRQPVTTWVTLTDMGQKSTELGEIMFSLSYLPTAERLTIVVVKARNMKFRYPESESSFVKVYLVRHGKKIFKKKTTIKKKERCPIFNESMIFNVPAHTLQTIQLRITIAENVDNDGDVSIGHVIIGAQASGRSLNHWNQMLATLRKPVAMWHPLRK